MKTIYKYPIGDWHGTVDLEMPVCSTPISVGVQKQFNGEEMRESMMLWAFVDDQENRSKVGYHIHIFGTGHELPEYFDRLKFVDTVQMGQYVWHVYYDPNFFDTII